VKDRFDQHLPRGNKVRGTKPTKKLGIIMVVLVCLFVGCHGQQAVMKLIDGKKKTLSISTEGENRMFYITVPKSSIVKCYTTGLSVGDADLYAEFGSEPNTDSDWASEGLFGSETVGPLEASTTSDRRLHVMVNAYTAFEDVQLQCDLTKQTTPPTEEPSSTPTCLAPASETTCSGNNAPAPLCCSQTCTISGAHRCCLPRLSTCTNSSECCNGHCFNKKCNCLPRRTTCTPGGAPCCVGTCPISGGTCP
jgi:hypothetical protein